MNAINNILNFNYNDHGSYIAPFGSMLTTAAISGKPDFIATFASVLIDKLGSRFASKIDQNKDLINRSVAVLAAAAATTAVQYALPSSPETPVALNFLANAVSFIATYKAIEALSPSKILNHVRLPAEIAVSSFAGIGVSNLLHRAGVPAESTLAAGGFLTMLAICSLALNDLFYTPNAAATASSTKPGSFHHIVGDLGKIRQLKDGRLMIPVQQKPSRTT